MNKYVGVLLIGIYFNSLFSMQMPEGQQHWQISNQSPQAIVIWYPIFMGGGKDVWEREKLGAMEDGKDSIVRATDRPMYIYTLAGSYSIYVKNNTLYIEKESLEDKISSPPVQHPMHSAMDLIVLVNPNGTVSIVDRLRKEHPAYLNTITPKVIELILLALENKSYDLKVLSTEHLKDILRLTEHTSAGNFHAIKDAIEKSKYFTSMNPIQQRRYLSNIDSFVRSHLDSLKAKVQNELKARDTDGTLVQMLQGEVGGSPYPLNILSVDVKQGLLSAINRLEENTAQQQEISRAMGTKNVEQLMQHAKQLKQKIEKHLKEILPY
ncbi:MAG: hypothetical protein AMXMBFR12_00220 [Candidatus Babeliales bacterium]